MVKRAMSFSTPVKSKRKKTFGKGPTTKSLAYRVAKLESQTEWKSKDFYSTTSKWTGAGTVTPIFDLAAGTGPDDRIGRKVTIRSVQLHWGLLNDSVATTTPQISPARTMIVYDKQSNGTAASYGDIMADQLGDDDQPWSFRNLDNKDRFIILYDSFAATTAGDTKTRDSVRVNYAGGDSALNVTDSEVYFGKVYRTMELPVVYSGDASGVPLSGALYVVCSGRGRSGKQKFLSRVRYVDE